LETMKKYIILIAAVFIQICLGASYSWSTFIPALKVNYGFSITQSQTIFTAIIITMTILMFAGGRIQDMIGPRIPAVIGGILLGAGYLCAGYSDGSFLSLFSFIGIISGIGVGLAYMAPIACAVKWFPNHKSLVTGIAVAGFGGSPIVIAQIGEHFLAGNVDVLTIFKYLGYAFIIIVPVFALFLENPEIEAVAAGETVKTKMRFVDIIKDRHFLALLAGFFPCVCIGLMIIGNIKTFGLSLNMSSVVAGSAISIWGLFNAGGRIGWGIIGGFLTYKKAILISLVCTCLICLCAPFAIKGSITFQLFGILAGFNHGACMVLYAAEVAQHYGAERMGSIYSTLFLSSCVAAIISPPVAGKVFDIVGSYTPVFISWGLILLGCIFLFNHLYQTKEASG
jgi:MFS transporter, OFA family, oxalate/formate antiporter